MGRAGVFVILISDDHSLPGITNRELGNNTEERTARTRQAMFVEFVKCQVSSVDCSLSISIYSLALTTRLLIQQFSFTEFNKISNLLKFV